MSVGKRIRIARQAAGLTQAQVADELEVNESSIRLYELDKRNPKPEMIERIAKVVGVAPQSLMEHRIDSARDALELLFRLEDACGLSPEEDGSLTFNPKSKDAKKLNVAIKQWAKMKNDLDNGVITKEEYESWKSKVD